MKTLVEFTALFILALCPPVLAKKANLKLEGLAADDDTSIVIKKGDVQSANTEYQIVDGKDEIFGAPDYDRSKAYTNWKTACTEWKQSMREMNKENMVLSLNCSAPAGSQEGEKYVFAGSSNYRLRVKVREKAN